MTKIDLNKRIFSSQSNSNNGEVSKDTMFHYKQTNDIISADYNGGDIVKGHLIGKVVNDEYLEFVYHHINTNGEIMTGFCKSYPEVSESGKIILKEYWQWTCKDFSKGESVLVEV